MVPSPAGGLSGALRLNNERETNMNIFKNEILC